MIIKECLKIVICFFVYLFKDSGVFFLMMYMFLLRNINLLNVFFFNIKKGYFFCFIFIIYYYILLCILGSILLL